MLAETEGAEEDRFKETFRVFSKNENGVIPMEEIKFSLSNVCSKMVGSAEYYQIRNIIDFRR